MRFSKKYKTYSEWKKSMPRESRYAKSIIRKHKQSPKATLKELRASKLNELDISKRSYESLSPSEKNLRIKALNAVSDLSDGRHLKDAAKEFEISVEELKRHLGDALFKKHGTYQVSKSNNIERQRWFYSSGKRVSVIINDSKLASELSKYLAAVRKALKSGDDNKLEDFKGKYLTDISGTNYTYETDLNILYLLEEMAAEEPFMTIYNL